MSVDLVVLVVELGVIAPLLYVCWEASQLLCLFTPSIDPLALLVRRSPLQLPPTGLEGVLLLFQYDFRGKVDLWVPRGLALRLAGVPTGAVVIPSVASHGTLIAVLIVVLLGLNKNLSIIENCKCFSDNNLLQSSFSFEERIADSRLG